MSEIEKKKLPAIGESVMVWPAERTVRDVNKQPVMKDGAVVTALARVRCQHGKLLITPTSVVVNAYYHKLLRDGNLVWCDKDTYQKNMVATAKAASSEAGSADATQAAAQVDNTTTAEKPTSKKVRGTDKSAADSTESE